MNRITDVWLFGRRLIRLGYLADTKETQSISVTICLSVAQDERLTWERCARTLIFVRA